MSSRKQNIPGFYRGFIVWGRSRRLQAFWGGGGGRILLNEYAQHPLLICAEIQSGAF